MSISVDWTLSFSSWWLCCNVLYLLLILFKSNLKVADLHWVLRLFHHALRVYLISYAKLEHNHNIVLSILSQNNPHTKQLYCFHKSGTLLIPQTIVTENICSGSLVNKRSWLNMVRIVFISSTAVCSKEEKAYTQYLLYEPEPRKWKLFWFGALKIQQCVSVATPWDKDYLLSLLDFFGPCYNTFSYLPQGS